MEQNSATTQRVHTLSLKHIRILADLMARERGEELKAAYAITPEGEKIDLLHLEQPAANTRA